jgi:hypothetical protein
LRVRRHAIFAACVTLGGYAALAITLTWPLAAHLPTHLPEIGGTVWADQHYLGWALAWQTHALTTDPGRFADANIYWPARMALFYGTPGFALLPIFAPVFLLTANPTLALNATLLLALALTATSLHAVTVRWTGSTLAGIAAAATYLVSTPSLTLCPMLPQYSAMAPMPVIVALAASRRLTVGRTAALAALIALQGLADVLYVAPPLVATLGLLAVARLARVSTRSNGAALLAALVAGVALLVPVYAGYLAVRAANPDLASQTVWAKMALLTTPTWWPRRGPLNLDGLVALPALLALVATAAGLPTGVVPRRRAWWCAGLWLATGVAASGALAKLVPSVGRLVESVGMRDPYRLGFGALIGASLLAGLGVAACAAAVSGPRARVPQGGRAIAIAYLASRLLVPRSLGAFPVGLAAVPGDEASVLQRGAGPVLGLPLGDPRLPGSQAVIVYRGIAHWRPMLNGYSSYHPRGFAERMALARRLPERAALEELRRETGLTSIVVYADKMPNMLLAPWLLALEQGDLPGARIAFRGARVLVLDVGAE